MNTSTVSPHVSSYAERVAQILCNGLYPEEAAKGTILADFPATTRQNLLTIAEAILVEGPRVGHPDSARLDWLMKAVNCDEIEGLRPLPFGGTEDEHLARFRTAIDSAIERAKVE